MNDFLVWLKAEVSGEVFRLSMTAFIVMIVPIVLRISNKAWFNKGRTMAQRRERYVFFRNIMMVAGFTAIVAIWGSRIAGFALSLAAVAGAILIVSKEAILNSIGFLAISMTRPFSFGDYIEVGGVRGLVVDINAMFTTVIEAREGNQVTGASATFPNSLVLTGGLKNLTLTGQFVVNLLSIKIPRAENALAHEKILLEVADQVCASWIKEADEHFVNMENNRHVDLPSAHAKVLIELKDQKMVDLTLRYSCRPNERVKVEQEIIRKYIEKSSQLGSKKIVDDDELAVTVDRYR